VSACEAPLRRVRDRPARTAYHSHLTACCPGRNPSVAILAASTICEMFLDSTRFFVPSRCFLQQKPNTIARAQNRPQPPAKLMNAVAAPPSNRRRHKNGDLTGRRLAGDEMAQYSAEGPRARPCGITRNCTEPDFSAFWQEKGEQYGIIARHC
jgi:hypothetical protein